MQRSVELDSYDDYESTTEGIRPRPMGNYPTQASLLSAESAPKKNDPQLATGICLSNIFAHFMLSMLSYPLDRRVAKVL